MALFHDITTAQLRQMIQLRERIDFLQEKLRKLRGDVSTHTPKRKLGHPAGKRTISVASRAKMTAGQNARWAKIVGKVSPTKSASPKASPPKKVMSPEAKAKIAAALKARWAAKKKDSAPAK